MKCLLSNALSLAIVALITCTAIVAQSGSAIEQANRYAAEAEELLQQEKYQEAAQRFEKSAEVENSSAEPRLRHLSFVLNAAAYCYEKHFQYDRAIELYTQSLDMARQLNETAQIAHRLHNIGRMYHTSRRFEQAIEYYTKALEFSRTHDRLSAIGKNLHSIGMAYYEDNEYEQALHYFEQALEQARTSQREAEIASRLNSIGEVYTSQGQYAKAAPYHQEALTLAKNSGSKAEIARSLNDVGVTLFFQGDPTQAIEYIEQAFELAQELHREEDLDTYLNNISFMLTVLGEHEQAIELLKNGLKLARERNRKAVEATILNALGNVYLTRMQFEVALNYIQQALDIAREMKDRARVATYLMNLGTFFVSLGQYAEAIPYYEQALPVLRELGRNGETAVCLSNLGSAYHFLGQYEKALNAFDEALNMFQASGRKVDDAVLLNNIGSVYLEWGQYEKAVESFHQALTIFEKAKLAEKAAMSYNNLGAVYRLWGQYDRAVDAFTQAVALFRMFERDAEVATGLNNLGTVYAWWGQPEKALEAFEQALSINQGLGKDAEIALNLNNIGSVYGLTGDYEQSLRYCRQALEIFTESGREAAVVLLLDNIGWLYYNLERYSDAISSLEQAASLFETLRQRTEGNARRDYLASQIHSYQLLIACYAKTNDTQGIVRTIEMSRAKRLAEQLAQSEEIGIPSLDQIQKTLPPDTAALIYANAEYLSDMILVMLTQDQIIVRTQAVREFVQKVLAQYGSEIAATPPSTPGSKRQKINSQLLQLYGDSEHNDAFAGIISYYRGGLYHSQIAKQEEILTGKLIGNFLYEFLFGPVQEALEGKSKLLIMADEWLNFVPFETLVNNRGQYVAETHQVSYTHSLQVLDAIRQRHYRDTRKSLLAFGEASYASSSSSAAKKEDALIPDTSYLYTALNKALQQGKPLHEFYTILKLDQWDDLPASLREVSAIRSVVAGANIIKYDEVNEARIKAMSGDGNLADYKVLHFATHGVAVPEIPELSALVLSQNDSGEEDGYLRVGEIAELKLHADFVNLSACETGLGKLYSGEGVVGLTQAFLLAGANGMSVSLWRVAEDSTARFMEALYRTVARDGLSYAEAITQVKRRFIAGEFGKKWKTPYYWAPFVYYGKSW